MKITKELLEHLKVRSMSLTSGKANLLCFLERVEKGKWTFSLPNKTDFAKGEKITINIVFYEEEQGEIHATVDDFGEDWLTIMPENLSENTRVNAFLTMLGEMESKYETFGRRRETRIRIGKERYRELGLSRLEQVLFLPGIKLQQPCAVLDASVHGICVITPHTKPVQDEENFCVKLTFTNPEETVILQAHKVYSRLDKTEGKTFATLSCQLLEPIHFAWKERVIGLLTKTES